MSLKPFSHRLFRALCLGVISASFLAGCTSGPSSKRPEQTSSLWGRILDTETQNFVASDELIRRAVDARLVMLGEAHDNAEHHRLQLQILDAMLRKGRKPALAMEQFDRRYQTYIDEARSPAVPDSEKLAAAGRFDRKGWRWPDYKPLIELALAKNLPILAANLSREEARAVMKTGQPQQGLAPADPAIASRLEQDIVDGHCGVRPPAAMLSGMVEAQRARDALMASVIAGTGVKGAVLIAGAGHARRNRGVPLYLPVADAAEVLSIGFIEVEPDAAPPLQQYRGVFDFVWFTAPAKREDPCKDFKLPR
jgi:uncharacterized iron-regulated protein